MNWRNYLVRIFRALSGLTQEGFAEAADVDAALLSQHERGKVEPFPETLARMGEVVGLTVADGEEILRYADTLRRTRQRAGRGVAELDELLSAAIVRAYQGLLRVAPPAGPPRPEDRQLAAEQWQRLESLAPDLQLAVVRTAPEFHHWGLVEQWVEGSVVEASRDIGRARHLARLAVEAAERVSGPEEWCRRLRGYAAGGSANALRVADRFKEARATLEGAKRLWLSGADPYGLLDPGRLLDIEASLCRAERRFEEALARLEEALPVSRCPARVLIKKGVTLEAMGEYARAVSALREAEPRLDREGEQRLYYMQRFNLAVNLTHLGDFTEAAGLAEEVREIAAPRGDEIELGRVKWLAGRICAGLGRREEALALLGEARRELAAREMGYDAALALLEEAVLLLQEGETAAVKVLTEELRKVFTAQGIHREAAAALRLFHQAAERERATADLARRLLAWLFRARHDEGLRFA